MGVRWIFDTKLEHLGKPIIDGFKILKLDNLTTEGVDIHVQTGYFQEDAAGNEIGFQPFTGEVVHVDGADYDTVKNTKGDAAMTLETLIMAEAFGAVLAKKGPTWAGTLKLK